MSTYQQLEETQEDPTTLLQFQDFQETTESTAAHTNYTLPPPTSTGETRPQTAAFWTVDYYKKYFDIDSVEVAERIVASLYPKKDFIALVSVNPDLYGPFWIPTTVIFALFASKNVAQYVTSIIESKKYDYSMSDLSWAFSSVYGFVTFIPLVLWGLCKYYQLPLSLLELIDLYGYGMAVWIPVSALCILNIEILRWVIVALAFALSVFFKLKNIQPVTSQAHNVRALMMLSGVIVVAQAGLAVLFKLVFFKEMTLPTTSA